MPRLKSSIRFDIFVQLSFKEATHSLVETVAQCVRPPLTDRSRRPPRISAGSRPPGGKLFTLCTKNYSAKTGQEYSNTSNNGAEPFVFMYNPLRFEGYGAVSQIARGESTAPC
ncbi:hypothetical protein EYF80_025246 [Liparis tanakae]|uniref:Uncharacterized protein n=1 Tax=Liparis tanakae TaxID=230148 RepID=A0A4Z2HF47_9TELE|nr:hypothetical protein EYF80_025246 [Liparis tanakae]